MRGPLEKYETKLYSFFSPLFLILSAILLIIGIIILFSFILYKNEDQSIEQEKSLIEQKNLYIGSASAQFVNKNKQREIKLYFYDASNNKLVMEKRNIFQNIDVVSEIRETIIELLKGSSQHFKSLIPQGTKLREVFIDLYQTAYIDFTEELSSECSGDIEQEALIVLSIISTVRDNFPQISRVQILINGKQQETLHGHIMIDRPLTGDEFNF